MEATEIYQKIELIPIYNLELINFENDQDSLFIDYNSLEDYITPSDSSNKPNRVGIITKINSTSNNFYRLDDTIPIDILSNISVIDQITEYRNYMDLIENNNFTFQHLIDYNINIIADILRKYQGQYNKIYYLDNRQVPLKEGSDINDYIIEQIQLLPIAIREVRIKGPLGKIFATSDIHGDIMPLLVNMRDLCQIIKKKEGFDKPDANNRDYNAIAELNKPYRLIARHKTSDIPEKDLYKEDLNYEWCGGNSIFVICGDIIDNVRDNADKKPYEFPMEEAKILMFINAINKQAMAHGGRIFKIIGNHELMNIRATGMGRGFISKYAHGMLSNELIGNYPNTPLPRNYTNFNINKYHENENKTIKSEWSNREKYFMRGNPGALMLAEDNIYVCLAIGDFIFVHGGIYMQDIANYYQTIEEANNYLNQYIRGMYPIKITDSDSKLGSIIDLTDDRTFGLKYDYIQTSRDELNDLSNEELEINMCDYLITRFDKICNNPDLINNAHIRASDKNLETNYKDTDTGSKYLNITSNFWIDFKKCDPGSLKLVIGHCIQHSDNILFNTRKFTRNQDRGDNGYIEYTTPIDKDAKYDKPAINTSCGTLENPSIFRVDIGVSRGFNTSYPEDPRNPQVLVMEYSNPDSNPDPSLKITVRESPNGNNNTHIPEWCSNECTPLEEYNGGNKLYYLKYLKYKTKYLKLKK